MATLFVLEALSCKLPRSIIAPYRLENWLNESLESYSIKRSSQLISISRILIYPCKSLNHLHRRPLRAIVRGTNRLL